MLFPGFRVLLVFGMCIFVGLCGSLGKLVIVWALERETFGCVRGFQVSEAFRFFPI